jgi:16S rRNA G966 N2-methylase RsmD
MGQPLSKDQDVARSLSRIDWNFPRASTLSNSVHTLHWFPGNFIPQLPSYLIQMLSNEGDVVLDPFCGSGTTGVEAMILARRSWQSDANRVGVLITRGKLAALTCPTLKEHLTKIAERTFWNLSERCEAGRQGEGTDSELNSWFHPDTLTRLRRIWHAIEEVADPGPRAVLDMIFSDTLFACASTLRSSTSGGSKRRHHWGWVADNVRPRGLQWHDATKLFVERISRLHSVVTSIPHLAYPEAVVRLEDARSLSAADDSVDLVVTSPPYLGMIDYARANRLTYLWFGCPLTEDRDIEIGARWRRERKVEPASYLLAIESSCREISRVLRGGRYCAIVIGESRKFAGMAGHVIEAFEKYLIRIWGPWRRVPSRRRISERRGTEPYEYVCVFRKD